MATGIRYPLGIAPPQCRPQFALYNNAFREENITNATDDTELTTTSASSRFSSCSRDQHGSCAITGSSHREVESRPSLPRQAGAYYIKKPQGAETFQIHNLLSSSPRKEQQKHGSVLSSCPLRGSRRYSRRSREPVASSALSEDRQQPQWQLLRIPRPTSASRAAIDTISNPSVSSPELVSSSRKRYLPHLHQESQQWRPTAGNSLLGQRRITQIEERLTATRTTPVSDAAPAPRTDYWRKAPARERGGTAEKEEWTVLLHESAKDYRHLCTQTTSSLSVASGIDPVIGNLAGKEFSKLLQSDPRAAALNPPLCTTTTPFLFRRQKQPLQQTSRAHEVEAQHRLQQRQKLQQQRRLEWQYWQQQQREGVKQQQQQIQRRSPDLHKTRPQVEELLWETGQHETLSSTVQHTHSDTPTAVISAVMNSKSRDAFSGEPWDRRKVLPWRTPLTSQSHVCTAPPPCSVLPSVCMNVPSVTVGRPFSPPDEKHENFEQQQYKDIILEQNPPQREECREPEEREGGTASRSAMKTTGVSTLLDYSADPGAVDRYFPRVCVDQDTAPGDDTIITAFAPCRGVVPASSELESSTVSLSDLSSSTFLHCPYNYNTVAHSTTAAVPYLDTRAAAIVAIKAATAIYHGAAKPDSPQPSFTFRNIKSPTHVTGTALPVSNPAAPSARDHQQTGIRNGHHAVASEYRPLSQRLPISYEIPVPASPARAVSPEVQDQEKKQWQEKESMCLHPQKDVYNNLQGQQRVCQGSSRSGHYRLKKLPGPQQGDPMNKEQEKWTWKWVETSRERPVSKCFFDLPYSAMEAECCAASRRPWWLSCEEKQSTTALFDLKSHFNSHSPYKNFRGCFTPGASNTGRRPPPSPPKNLSATMAFPRALISDRCSFSSVKSRESVEEKFNSPEERYSPTVTLPGWSQWKRADATTTGAAGVETDSSHNMLRLRVHGYKAGQRELQTILGAIGVYIRRMREQQQHDRKHWELLLLRRDSEMQHLRQEKDVLKQELQDQMEKHAAEIDSLKEQLALQQQELQELQEELLHQRRANMSRKKEESDLREEAEILKGKLLETQAKERQAQDELRVLENRLICNLDESAKYKEEAERAWKDAQEECKRQKRLTEELLQGQQLSIADELRTAEERLKIVNEQLSGEKLQRQQVNEEVQALCRQLSGEKTRRMQLERELQLLTDSQSYLEFNGGESPESSVWEREQRWQGLRRRHQLFQQQRNVQNAALFKATLEAHRVGIAPHVLQHDQALQSQFEEQGNVDVFRPRRRAGLVDEEAVVQKELLSRKANYLQAPGREDAERRATISSGQVSSQQDIVAAKFTRYSVALPLKWTREFAKTSSLQHTLRGQTTGSHGDECVDYTAPLNLNTAHIASSPETPASVAVAAPGDRVEPVSVANVSAPSQRKKSLPGMSRKHTTAEEGKKHDEMNMAVADIAGRAAAVTGDAVAETTHDVSKAATLAATDAIANPSDTRVAAVVSLDSAKHATAIKAAVPRRKTVPENAAAAVRAKPSVSAASAIPPSKRRGDDFPSGSALSSGGTPVEVNTFSLRAEVKQTDLPSKIQSLTRAKPGPVVANLAVLKRGQPETRKPEHATHRVEQGVKKGERAPVSEKGPAMKILVPSPPQLVASPAAATDGNGDAAGSLLSEDPKSVSRENVAKHSPTVGQTESGILKPVDLERNERRESTVPVKKSPAANASSANAQAEAAPLSKADSDTPGRAKEAVAESDKTTRPEETTAVMAEPLSKKVAAAEQGMPVKEKKISHVARAAEDSRNEQTAKIHVTESPTVSGEAASKEASSGREAWQEKNVTAVITNCVSRPASVEDFPRQEQMANNLRDNSIPSASQPVSNGNASSSHNLPPCRDLPVPVRAVAQHARVSEEALPVKSEHSGPDKLPPSTREQSPIDAKRRSGVDVVSNLARAPGSTNAPDPLMKAVLVAEQQEKHCDVGAQPDIAEQQSACVDDFLDGTSYGGKKEEYVEAASSTTRSSIQGGDEGTLDPATNDTTHTSEPGEAVREIALRNGIGRADDSVVVLPISRADTNSVKQSIQKGTPGELRKVPKRGLAQKSSTGEK